MTFDERLIWLLIGCIIGYFLGFITGKVQNLKQEIDEVNPAKRRIRSHDEAGFMRYPIVADFALFLVIIVTAYAAFQSQHTSNLVTKNQQDIARGTTCNQKFIRKTLSTLNQRTAYTKAQIAANLKLQKAQSDFLRVLLKVPPTPEEDRVKATQDYYATLINFISISEKNRDTVASNPFPKIRDLKECLTQKVLRQEE